MKSLDEFTNLYIHRDPVDLRKNIHGLSVIVQEEMRLDLQSQSAFIFCNKPPRTHMKILYFDRSGFALWLKKLEGSKCSWPVKLADETIPIAAKDMAMPLEGINLWTRFESVHFDHLI